MQLDIDNCDQYRMKRKIKTLFNQVFKYSMQNDIISKDYSDYIDVGKKTIKTDRRIFTDFEIKRLTQVANEIEYADTVLIMIYSGLRLGELFDIKAPNIALRMTLWLVVLKPMQVRTELYLYTLESCPTLRKRLKLTTSALQPILMALR